MPQHPPPIPPHPTPPTPRQVTCWLMEEIWWQGEVNGLMLLTEHLPWVYCTLAMPVALQGESGSGKGFRAREVRQGLKLAPNKSSNRWAAGHRTGSTHSSTGTARQQQPLSAPLSA